MTYPTIMPALTLDFLNSQQLDPRITYSRASSATYVDGGVIKTAPANVARFEEKGLLIEASRTNYFLNSNSGATSKWNPYAGVTISSSTNTAPDGSTNAIRIEATTSGQYAELAWTAPSTGTYTASIYIRSRTSADQSVKLDFSGSTPTVQTVPASGEWVRLRDTQGSSLASGGRYFYVQSLTTETLDVDVWGEQVELGSFASSFIPTSGSTVTRAAEFVQLLNDNFSNWYNQGEGSFLTSAEAIGIIPSSQNTVLTTEGYRLPEFKFDGGNATVYTPVLGSYTQSVSTPKANFGFSLDGAGATRAVNGAVSTVANTTITDTNTKLYLGKYFNSASFAYFGYISRLAYYNERLTDAELTTLTS